MPPLSDNKLYKSAVWYAKKGWPVIALHAPNGHGSCSCQRGAMCSAVGKHPRFHAKLLKAGAKSGTTDPELIKKWWTLWPDANVGIATGAASFDVLDVDIRGNGPDTLREHAALFGGIPDTIEQITGSGGRQIMFQYVGGLKNEVRFANGLDIRTDGGLVVVPPSLHVSGRKYEWEASSRPSETELAPMPKWLLDWIMEASQRTESGNGDHAGVDPLKIFCGIEKGERDHELFRYACRLRAKGISRVEAEALILAAADRCKPRFSHAEALKKLEQGWKYDAPDDVTNVTYVTNVPDVTSCHQMSPNVTSLQKGSLPVLVREWLDCTEGVFHYNDLARDLQLLSLKNKDQKPIQNLKKLLSRMVEDGTLERVGTRAGTYRLIQQDAAQIKWWESDNEEYEILLPLDIGSFARLFPGNICVIAGESNAAKTAIMLEIARLNLHSHAIRYQSSEMEGQELRSRLEGWSEVCSLDEWRRVDFRKCPENYQDFILPDALNIVDYVEIHDEFWKLGGTLRAIHDKLQNGVCFIAMQKKPGVDVGKGGYVSLEKPRLYLSVGFEQVPGSSPCNVIKVIKCKSYRDRERNPHGMKRRFKVYGGWQIKPLGEWWHD